MTFRARRGLWATGHGPQTSGFGGGRRAGLLSAVLHQSRTHDGRPTVARSRETQPLFRPSPGVAGAAGGCPRVPGQYPEVPFRVGLPALAHDPRLPEEARPSGSQVTSAAGDSARHLRPTSHAVLSNKRFRRTLPTRCHSHCPTVVLFFHIEVLTEIFADPTRRCKKWGQGPTTPYPQPRSVSAPW